MPVSGWKHDLIERLKKSIGRSANINESSDGEKITGDVVSLQKLTVEQLKTLLRQKGLPVSGRKKELVHRLKNGSKKGGPKPKAWQHSDAKLDPTSSIHNMSLESVRKSDDRFGLYPNFAKYYADWFL